MKEMTGFKILSSANGYTFVVVVILALVIMAIMGLVAFITNEKPAQYQMKVWNVVYAFLFIFILATIILATYEFPGTDTARVFIGIPTGLTFLFCTMALLFFIVM